MTTTHDQQPAEITESAAIRQAIATGHTFLGIEFGSTRIKACLVGPDHTPIATGSHEWENQLVDGVWTYPLDMVWSGLQASYTNLLADVAHRYQVRPTTFAAIGISAMMHGYLPFDTHGQLLVPFRTWRNTATRLAAAELTQALGFNVPLRWSVAHLYQAVLDHEPHLPHIRSLTTLAGYVHQQLTGQPVLGIGDASGMFPIDPATRNYDQHMLTKVDQLIASRVPGLRLTNLLPKVLVAGQPAGHLTARGAELLDPTGTLRPGIPLCPPEGDAGTGMVATNSVAPHTGNISVGTSIFAMIVLDRPLQHVHPELDIVTTPAGDPVAMVHCNNGADELATWANLFSQFAAALGHPTDTDTVFRTLLPTALTGEPDAGGLLAYNYLSGEPITGLTTGRPLITRTPDSRLTLANFTRAQLDAAFATLSLGMQVLAKEGVTVQTLYAHGGLFRTPGPAQQLLAAAVNAPVAVGQTAGEGGAWGIAILAAYQTATPTHSLQDFLADTVFRNTPTQVTQPQPRDVEGFTTFLTRYRTGLAIEQAAANTL